MSRSKRMAPSLAANWARVAAQIRPCPRVVVFLDFDGTLVDLTPLPDQVRLAPAARRVLQRLASHPRATVAVISGRRRSELRHYIGLRGIHYCGLYGWERRNHSPYPKSALAALRSTRSQVSAHLPRIPGLWIEDKRFSLSLHLLDVPPAAQQRARREIRSLLRPFRHTLRLIENLRDAEIVPRCIEGKGSAVRRFLAEQGGRRVLPFYFGDDLSDEPAFDAVGQGISVRIGAARPTRARYAVRNPAAVAAILGKLEAALGK
jgi:trehalose-phosphatase